jgi:uncharacterized repeat protein (TIGR01451 family)
LSEHKSVIIDLEETEKTGLGERGGQESAGASGVLSVHNTSDGCRIWNVKVLLGESRAKTSIENEALAAGEIEAGGKWTSAYTIDIDGPIVTLTEVYDTCGSVDAPAAHWAYVHGKDNPVTVTLTVKNETDGQLDGVILNKTIPPELSDLVVVNVKSGNADYDEGTHQLVWKDLIIYPKEESTLVFTAVATLGDAEVKSAGDIVLTYKAEGQQRSALNPELTALTEFLTGIETAETEPNQWECTLECSNESDLIVRLDKAEVYLTPESGGERKKMIDESPHKELAPGKEWSAKFEVGSKSPPKCTQEVVYTPVRKVTKRVVGTIEKSAQPIPVAKITYTKEFDPPEVDSFDKTPVEVDIIVKNAGSAALNDVIIMDNLPDDVMPPKKEHVSVWIRGEQYTGDFTLNIEPDDQNPEVPHQLTVGVKGLADSIGELQPGEVLKVNYALMAWRVRPEKEYPSPIEIMANTNPEGLTADASGAADAHKLGVVYKKRRISAKKAINKGADPGEFVIMLVVENKGEVTVENVQVTDWIPSGFTYRSVEPIEDEPEVKAVADGSTMKWLWTRMSPGDQMKLRVTVQGDGEYERREPEVTSD